MSWPKLKRGTYVPVSDSGFAWPVSECPHEEVFMAWREHNEHTKSGFEVCGQCGKKWPR